MPIKFFSFCLGEVTLEILLELKELNDIAKFWNDHCFPYAFNCNRCKALYQPLKFDFEHP
uniref:Uncharacterized protein n=1 Tax=Rhodnius prolixus TaxID=13249 RepID=T1I9L4_RHOPR